MLGILIGGRFWDFKCLIWNFLIWKQQNLHIKENDQHLVQLLPNKLVTPFITVLLVSINVFASDCDIIMIIIGITMQVTGIACPVGHLCKLKDKSNERRQNAHLIFTFTRKNSK